MDINEIEHLAQEKANEMIYKQKMKDLTDAVTEIVSLLPSSLKNLRMAIELLDREFENHSKDVKTGQGKSRKEHEDIIGLMQKVVKSESVVNQLTDLSDQLVNRNIDSSLIRQIELMSYSIKEQITDVTNANSIASIISKRFDEQDKRLNELDMMMNDSDNDKSLITRLSAQLEKILEEVNSKNTIKGIVTWILASISAIVVILDKLGVFSV